MKLICYFIQGQVEWFSFRYVTAIWLSPRLVSCLAIDIPPPLFMLGTKFEMLGNCPVLSQLVNSPLAPSSTELLVSNARRCFDHDSNFSSQESRHRVIRLGEYVLEGQY
jgi:hypothetical protein